MTYDKIILGPNHSVYLHSDYGMVERIFQNLIINAIRYSSGSIKIDLKQGKEKSAIFIIENPIDSKVEIDPNRLFERFYTGDKSRHNSGTGVGLAVVKLLTDKLGGNVFEHQQNGPDGQYQPLAQRYWSAQKMHQIQLVFLIRDQHIAKAAHGADTGFAHFVAQIVDMHFQGVGRGFIVPVIDVVVENFPMHRTACFEH